MGVEIPGFLRTLAPVVVGQNWPQGDETALRSLGQGHADTGRQLGPVAESVDTAVRQAVFGADQSAGVDALRTLGQRLAGGDESVLGTLAQACAELDQLCQNAAEEIEYTKYLIIGCLVLLAAQIAALIAGAVETLGTDLAAIPLAELAARSTVQSVFRALLSKLAGMGVSGALMGKVLQNELFTMGLDAGVQGLQFAEGHRTSWDGDKTRESAILGLAGGIVGTVGEMIPRGATDALAGSVVGGLVDQGIRGGIRGGVEGAATVATAAAMQGQLDQLSPDNLLLGAGAGAVGGTVGINREKPFGDIPGVLKGDPEIPDPVRALPNGPPNEPSESTPSESTPSESTLPESTLPESTPPESHQADQPVDQNPRPGDEHAGTSDRAADVERAPDQTPKEPTAEPSRPSAMDTRTEGRAPDHAADPATPIPSADVRQHPDTGATQPAGNGDLAHDDRPASADGPHHQQDDHPGDAAGDAHDGPDRPSTDTGLATPDTVDSYVRDMLRLQDDWPALDEGQRRWQLEDIVNRQLTAHDIPPVTIRTDGELAAGDARFDRADWAVRIAPDDVRSTTPEDVRKLNELVYRAARHAEQHHLVARMVAGDRSSFGEKGEQVARYVKSATRIDNADVVRSATERPLYAGSPEYDAAKKWYSGVRGRGGSNGYDLLDADARAVGVRLARAADPTGIEKFDHEMDGLARDWSDLTNAEREQRIQDALNEIRSRKGLPPIIVHLREPEAPKSPGGWFADLGKAVVLNSPSFVLNLTVAPELEKGGVGQLGFLVTVNALGGALNGGFLAGWRNYYRISLSVGVGVTLGIVGWSAPQVVDGIKKLVRLLEQKLHEESSPEVNS